MKQLHLLHAPANRNLSCQASNTVKKAFLLSLLFFFIFLGVQAKSHPAFAELPKENSSCNIALTNPGESGNCPGVDYIFEANLEEPCASATYYWEVYFRGQGIVESPDLDTTDSTLTFRPGRCGVYEIALIVECENGASPECILSFEVSDKEAPTLTKCPVGGSTSGCSPDAIFPALTLFPLSKDKGTEISVEDFEKEGGMAFDNCGDITITYRDVVSGKCEFIITRFYYINDQCKNVNQDCFQQFFVEPPAPIISCPPDVIVDCKDNTTPEGTGFAEAIDPCSPETLVSLGFRDSKPDFECAYQYFFFRTWTATSFCGAISRCTQKITVQDTKAPTIENFPVDTVVSCDNIPAVPELTVTDNCDPSPSVTFKEYIHRGDCPNNFIISRVWRLEDACGNRRVSKQLIMVEDTVAPIVDLEAGAADVTLKVNDEKALADALSFLPVFSDNCTTSSALDVSLISDEENQGTDCTEACIRVRSWTAVDACGNVSEAFTQTIRIAHNEIPVPDQELGAADVLIDCNDQESLDMALSFTPTFTFVCAQGSGINFFLSADDTIQDTDCPGTYVRIRSWAAEDGCGNVSEVFTQMIIVEDNKSPTIDGIPDDITVDCKNIPQPPQVVVTDNCDPEPALSIEEYIHKGACSNNFIISRVWRAEDACGNVRIDKQLITVVDNTAPIANQPAGSADATLAIDDLAAFVDTLAFEPTFIDNCTEAANISLRLISDDEVEGADCSTACVRIRKWVAEDPCGNLSEVFTQTITLIYNDVLVPDQKAGSADARIECGDQERLYEALDFVPTITINCLGDGGIRIFLSSDTIVQDSDCPIGYTRTRTWTAEGLCGRGNELFTQVIIVEDNKSPVINGVPEDITVDCNSIPEIPEVTVSDNCDPNPVLTLEEYIDYTDCPIQFLISRVWRVEDSCGNRRVRKQIITVYFDAEGCQESTPCTPELLPSNASSPARLFNQDSILAPGTRLDPQDKLASPGGNLARLSLYPNPAFDHLQVILITDLPGTIFLDIYNLNGQRVRRIEKELFTGENRFTLPVGTLHAGMYYIVYPYGEKLITERFVKSPR